MHKFSVILGLALLLSACASGGSSRDQSNRDVLSQAQLAETGQTNAFEAVRSLQPRWLRGGLSVYIDGAPVAGGRREGGAAGAGNRAALGSAIGSGGGGGNEGVNYLRNLTITSIREMRYLDPRLASIKYGMGMGIVIEIDMVR